jgi:N utilization substance protein B
MQTLFQCDFLEKSVDEAVVALHNNIEEFAPGLDQVEYLEDILRGVVKKQKVLDTILEKAAPEWPINKINAVDRNILRLGLYELLFGNHDDVPPKVAINEAIELAKSFGGESSGRFVNGVLGAIYKEMGEPRKDETKSNHHVKEDPSKFPVEKKAGAVVYAEHNGEIYFAMVHDVFGYWTLAKGSVEEDESEEESAMREVYDEIGLPIVCSEVVGKNEYIANHPEKGKIKKRVTYFLAEAPYLDINLKASGGLDDAKWFSLEEVGDLKMYDDIAGMMATSIAKLTEAK